MPAPIWQAMAMAEGSAMLRIWTASGREVGLLESACRSTVLRLDKFAHACTDVDMYVYVDGYIPINYVYVHFTCYSFVFADRSIYPHVLNVAGGLCQG